MKKLKPRLTALALTAFLILALALSAVPVVASGTAVSIDAPPEVSQGGTFTVDIDVDSVENLCGVQFEVSYDNTVIETTGTVRKGDFWGDESVAIEPSQFPGKLRVIIIFSPTDPWSGVTGSGTLVEIDFDVVGDGGQTSELDMSPQSDYNMLGNCMVQEIPATWGDDSVHVTSTTMPTPTPTPNGTPSPTDTPTPTLTPTPPDLTGGLLWWHYLLIGLGALVVLVFIVILFTRRTIS